jgi:hypothetical protein
MDMFAVRIVRRSEMSSSAERGPVPKATKSRCKRGTDAPRRLDVRRETEDLQRRLWQMTWPQPKPRVGHSVCDCGASGMSR